MLHQRHERIGVLLLVIKAGKAHHARGIADGKVAGKTFGQSRLNSREFFDGRIGRCQPVCMPLAGAALHNNVGRQFCGEQRVNAALIQIHIVGANAADVLGLAATLVARIHHDEDAGAVQIGFDQCVGMLGQGAVQDARKLLAAGALGESLKGEAGRVSIQKSEELAGVVDVGVGADSKLSHRAA